ncbi:hypothetical protein I316_04498 [Kwoniella heveanensis BCC8398]|uniref:Uncharacterized protein n=1 Tax=Kwoniella heveanensis BCC8398 TaxID=1296120 RepID=A0A1B9GRY2_9TREE|nr:hypothetical protein I316_04498 [Kwoniella heveanensis BCC8398]
MPIEPAPLTCLYPTSMPPTSISGAKTSSPNPLSLDRIPGDIIHLLFQAFDDNLPPSSLANLAQCSWEMHERFTPVLYRNIDVHKGNMGSIVSGLEPEMMTMEGSTEGSAALRKRVTRNRRKESLLSYTEVLVLHDLPSIDALARVSSAKCLASLRTSASSTKSPPQSHSQRTPSVSYFPSIHPTLFPSLHTLVFSGKAILALADLYNASSWGDSPSLLPSNTLLRSIKDHLNPTRRLVCHYPQVMVGLHMHSCIEEVIAYLTSSWDLDTLQWIDLSRSMVGSVPKARKLQYHFKSCDSAVPKSYCDSRDQPSKGSVGTTTTFRGCAAHYDHVSLTASTYLDHCMKRGKEAVGEKLEIGGVGCMFSLEWDNVVDEIWSRMGVLDGDDWMVMECWKRANVTLLA